MRLPDGFRSLFAVVSDFHLWTSAEEAYERFLWSHNARRGLADRIWNWMVRIHRNLDLAHTLLATFGLATDTLVSLGDHYPHTVNEYGLGEQRARVCALAVHSIFEGRRWDRIIWVPSDHDIGVTHQLSALTNVQ